MRSGWLVTASAVAVLAFAMLPVLAVVLYSFSDRSFFAFPPTGFSLQWYVRAVENPVFADAALRSAVLAALATAAAAGLAIPAALGMQALGGTRYAAWIDLAIQAPLIVPALVIGIALLRFFVPLGLLDTFAGLAAAHTLIVLPFMFRAVYVSARALDRRLVEASEVLGASPWITFWRVELPALAPGITSGAVFSFIVSFDQFTISLFVTQSEQVVLPVAIYRYLFDVNDPVAAVVSTVMVAMGLLVAAMLQRLGWLRHVGGTGG